MPSPAIWRPASSTLSARLGSILLHSAANACSQYASRNAAKRSTRRAGSSNSSAAARRRLRAEGAGLLQRDRAHLR